MRERNEIIKMIRFGQRLIGTKDDGIIGKNSIALIEKKSTGILAIDYRWKPERKLIALIQLSAISKGIEAGIIDGLVGSQTRYAFELLIHLEKFGRLPDDWRSDHLATGHKASRLKTNPHGFPTYKNIKSFYGEPGKGLKTVSIPFEMRLAWDVSVKVSKITCHRKVANSLLGVLEDLIEHYTLEGIKQLGIDLYGGCFNQRKMRGGSSLSTHSWGAAIDLHPSMNRLRWNHKKALFAKPEYKFLLEAFAAEGWVSLGMAKDYDWMHFQAVRL